MSSRGNLLAALNGPAVPGHFGTAESPIGRPAELPVTPSASSSIASSSSSAALTLASASAVGESDDAAALSLRRAAALPPLLVRSSARIADRVILSRAWSQSRRGLGAPKHSHTVAYPAWMLDIGQGAHKPMGPAAASSCSALLTAGSALSSLRLQRFSIDFVKSL